MFSILLKGTDFFQCGGGGGGTATKKIEIILVDAYISHGAIAFTQVVRTNQNK